jgi:two-component system, NtrC family, sensor histidine kinase HydH
MQLLHATRNEGLRFVLDSIEARHGGEPAQIMLDRTRSRLSWIDLVLILFLAGLAFIPPIDEIHKQFILLAIVIFQLFEGRLVAWNPQSGPALSVGIKIVLATLLLDHTGEMGINSPFYPIYYLPIVTAAIYFGPVATLFWTALTSAAYCSFLIPALQEYEFSPESATLLSLRILFFFLVAVLVNRFVVENRRQVARYQALSETLEETNRQLRRAEADARRAERLAALGQLSAGLAHEIRNPLGIIKGSAEMLTQKLENSQPLARELAGYIYTEVNRLNALVSRFLDFARPLQVQLRPVRVPELLDASFEAAHAQFPAANVRVERDYAPDLPEILADRQLCELLFVNLIVNAYQAMDGPMNGVTDAARDGTVDTVRGASMDSVVGGQAPRQAAGQAPGQTPGQPLRQQGVLRLSAARETSNGHAGVAVVIQDSGPGVPDELREQIFNPFFTSKKEGVGLGLAIVAKIADNHRGSIKLEKNSGRGASFHVFLPLKPE